MKKLLLLFSGLIISISLLAQVKKIEETVYTEPEKAKERQEYFYKILRNPITGEIPKDIRKREIEFVKNNFANLKNKKSTWVPRGPWNVGGRTRAIVIDYSDTTRIIAAGVSGGIWVSDDYGISWTRASIPAIANALSVTDIEQDPNNPNVLYYVGGEYIGNSASEYGAYYNGAGIFKSTDGGYTWNLVYQAGLQSQFDSYFDYIWNIEVDKTGRIWVAAYGGIFVSDDGGNSFKPELPTTPNLYMKYTDIAINSDNIIVAYLSDSTIYKAYFLVTRDTGENWYSLNTNWGATGLKRAVIAADSITGKIFYVIALDQDETKHYLGKYKIDFSSGYYIFINLTNNIPMLGGLTGNFDSQGGYDLTIAIHPNDTSIIYLGGINLYFSTDGFYSTSNIYWAGGYTPQNNSYRLYTNHHPDIHVLTFNPKNPQTLLCGHDGGISITYNSTDIITNADGESIDWEYLNNGYITTQAYHVSIDPTGTHSNDIIAGFQDNGSWYTNSTVLTDDWWRLLGGDGGYNAIIDNGTAFIVSSQKASFIIYFFDNLGYYQGYADIAPPVLNPLFITPFVIDPNDNNIMYTIDDTYILRNTKILSYRDSVDFDGPAKTWEILQNSQIYNDFYTAIAVSTTPANILYAGTYNGKLYKFISANLGDPLPTNITGSNFPEGTIISIAVDPDDANKILVAFSNYSIPSIFYTTDGGSTWTDVSGNLEENPDGSGNGPSVRSVAILKNGAQTVYFAGTSAGLFSTTSLTPPVTWTQEDPTTIGYAVVPSIVTRSDGTVVIGTHGNGIFSTTYSVSSISNEAEDTKLNIYPNPATDITAVEIPKLGGNLLIYTVDGKLIYYSKPNSAKHLIKLEHFAPGTYFVRYLIDSKVYHSKLIVQ